MALGLFGRPELKDIRPYLEKKYAIAQQDADSGTTRADAARLDAQTASDFNPARIGLANASAFETTERGLMTKPLGRSRIKLESTMGRLNNATSGNLDEDTLSSRVRRDREGEGLVGQDQVNSMRIRFGQGGLLD